MWYSDPGTAVPSLLPDGSWIRAFRVRRASWDVSGKSGTICDEVGGGGVGVTRLIYIVGCSSGIYRHVINYCYLSVRVQAMQAIICGEKLARNAVNTNKAIAYMYKPVRRASVGPI